MRLALIDERDGAQPVVIGAWHVAVSSFPPHPVGLYTDALYILHTREVEGVLKLIATRGQMRITGEACQLVRSPRAGALRTLSK